MEVNGASGGVQNRDSGVNSGGEQKEERDVPLQVNQYRGEKREKRREEKNKMTFLKLLMKRR